MSRRRTRLLSTTVYWFTKCQSLAPRSSMSIARTWAHRTRPSPARYRETVPPSPSDERCECESQTLVLSDRVSLPKASPRIFAEKVGVESSEGMANPTPQHDIGVIVTLRTWCIQGDIRAVSETPAATFEPGECSDFDLQLRLRLHEPRSLIS